MLGETNWILEMLATNSHSDDEHNGYWNPCVSLVDGNETISAEGKLFGGAR